MYLPQVGVCGEDLLAVGARDCPLAVGLPVAVLLQLMHLPRVDLDPALAREPLAAVLALFMVRG